jgi:phospholipid/cholesterol/gamma-HCH transport system permease protein
VRSLSKLFEFVGKMGLFSLRVVTDSLRPLFEFAQLSRQLAEVGNKSFALIVVSGFLLLQSAFVKRELLLLEQAS